MRDPLDAAALLALLHALDSEVTEKELKKDNAVRLSVLLNQKGFRRVSKK